MRDFPCRDGRAIALEDHGWLSFGNVDQSDV
jgi:hypothetical protein